MKLIAETAWHHEGDAEFLHSLVNNIISSKADIIKLHLTLDLDEYMLEDHDAYSILSTYLISQKVWEEVITKIKKSGKELMLLYNDSKAIEVGTRFNPSMVEIHSVCLNDIRLLHKLRENLQADTKIVLGVGGSTLEEIEFAVDALNSRNIVLMFGFQNYPTNFADINLDKIKKVMKMYPMYEFGYADHTAWDYSNNELVTLFGAALGMKYIEKHVTTQYGVQRTDYSAAITFEMLDSLKEKMGILESCSGDGRLKLNEGEKSYSVLGPMKKAPILNTDVKANEELTLSKVSFARSSQISNMQLNELTQWVGQKFRTELSKNHALMKEDLIQ